tara:strand:+ start:2155 stop:3876 length:1722 start_codon:yes stop_codon:yes gene_type:complete
MNSSEIRNQISIKLRKIYKPFYKKKELVDLSDEIVKSISRSNKIKNSKKSFNLSEKTSLLICYGDSVLGTKTNKSITELKKFYNKYLYKCFNSVHFLPFYPSSSDSGFAVKDHYKIDPRLGKWGDIKSFSKNSFIMADVVINHSSSRGLWFKNYLRNISPGKNYFFTVSQKFNSKNVVRPREHRLLKKVSIFGKNRYLWRTFSNDQIDLNFKNPKVLIRFIKIIINLINHGVNIFRLDAIAYLWKESGTKCINLKQTHEIIKILRIVCNSLNKSAIIVTETNLPESENISYFGNYDEANWIYNFSLPPLLVHSLLFEDSRKITSWSKKLPQNKLGNSYLNFIASHDGIGMRPVEGLLNKDAINKMFKRLKKNGGEFSFRKVQGKSKKVYEANITLFNAFQKTDTDPKGKYHYARYLCAHAIMISFEGIPAVYFNSMFGTANDVNKYIISNNKRDLNRYKWSAERLNKLLANKNSKQYLIYEEISNLLNIKQKNKAFHPNALRKTMNLGPKIFAFKRISLDKKQIVTCISNLSSITQNIKIQLKNKKYKELIIGTAINKNNITLDPFQTIWLSN